jgi:hypothetical protein
VECVAVIFLKPTNVDGFPIFSAGVGFKILSGGYEECYLLGYNTI